MRLSISLTNYSWRDVPLVDGLVRAAVAADQGGLDTVWVPDHLAQVDPTVPADAEDMLEAYGVLASTPWTPSDLDLLTHTASHVADLRPEQGTP
jgi:alkanesulfonate monooxygenase SsuD/methylene tetrahydromethanopterin reductase-like flavin-dependent oxidoreductase (luciferase family)